MAQLVRGIELIRWCCEPSDIALAARSHSTNSAKFVSTSRCKTLARKPEVIHTVSRKQGSESYPFLLALILAAVHIGCSVSDGVTHIQRRQAWNNCIPVDSEVLVGPVLRQPHGGGREARTRC